MELQLYTLVKNIDFGSRYYERTGMIMGQASPGLYWVKYDKQDDEKKGRLTSEKASSLSVIRLEI